MLVFSVKIDHLIKINLIFVNFYYVTYFNTEHERALAWKGTFYARVCTLAFSLSFLRTHFPTMYEVIRRLPSEQRWRTNQLCPLSPNWQTLRIDSVSWNEVKITKMNEFIRILIILLVNSFISPLVFCSLL